MSVISVIDVRGVTFRYAPHAPDVLREVHLAVEAGRRCLLVGANGAGKTTLLRVIAGRHMVSPHAVRVLGRPAFQDTSLAQEVVLLGGVFRFAVDIVVREILARQDAEPARRKRLIELLGVDPGWQMHQISDGQRRRVQLLLGLLHPHRVLLLDEITTDLDLLARSDLLAFLREESEQRGVTIVYATHILDRMETWATDVALLQGGTVRFHQPLGALDELGRLRAAGFASPLAHLAEQWLRAAVGR